MGLPESHPCYADSETPDQGEFARVHEGDPGVEELAIGFREAGIPVVDEVGMGGGSKQWIARSHGFRSEAALLDRCCSY